MKKPASHGIFAVEVNPDGRREHRVGDAWVDLYAVLGVAETANAAAIDDAIIAAAADCLCFAFARRGSREYIGPLQEYQAHFRLILLDETNRRQYDDWLALHRAGAPGLVSYDQFIAGVLPPGPVKRGFWSSLLRAQTF